MKILRRITPRIFYLKFCKKGGVNILLEEKILIKINKKNIEYFKNKGYNVELGRMLEINTIDLSPGSEKKIRCSCDYCGKEFFKMFCDYYKSPNKICCKECRIKKIQEIIKDKYGVDNVMQLDSAKQNFKNTCLKKYKAENPMQNKAIKEKTKETIKEKYGVENLMQNPEIQAKAQKTVLNKYGCKAPMQNQEIKEKSKNTCLKKYGVDNPMKNDKVKENFELSCLEKYGYRYPFQSKEIQEKAEQTCLRKYGVKHYIETEEAQRISRIKGRKNAPYSKAQKHICDLYKGELNYPFDRCFLDIYFPEYKIYCEYDGGGHDYSVKIGELTQEEFDKKEKNRWYYLHRKGLKEFRIKSKKDYLPSDDILIEMKNFAFNILNNNISSYIVFDIDSSEVKWKNNKQNFNF